MEQSVNLIEKILVLTKGKVEWLEEQNEILTETMQKQQVELQ
jgi:spore germination protein GerM